LHAIFAASHLGLRDGCRGTVVGKGRVQSREVNARLTRVPVDHGGILQVLAKDKMCAKEVFVELGESARLLPPRPLGSSQCPPRIGKQAS